MSSQVERRRFGLELWWMALSVLTFAFCLLVESVRAESDIEKVSPGLAWVADFLGDTPMYLPLFCLLPLAWWMRSGLIVHRTDLLRRVTTAWTRSCIPPAAEPPAAPSDGGRQVATAGDWCLALAVGAISILTSWQVSLYFGDLPPAIHDEYSYLFQAHTLLAGHLSVPSHTQVPELFDQVHVVNLGRFASRYYPGTGAWLAPWVALGHPYWGQWLASSLSAMLIFWTGRQLGGSGVGLVAGLLTACSPGLVLFSNLLLAHHPTLLGLSLFLYGFIRWLNERRPVRWLVAAGCGLAFAMLCRPATAAGVGLPFGIWFAGWLIFGQNTWQQRLRGAAGLGLPLVAGWLVMIGYNWSITGSWSKSPYQLYTDYYTPNHVYGFNNVIRGNAQRGQRVLPVVTRNYDAWAANLTPALAAENSVNRLVASLRWTFGLIPIGWICLAGASLLWREHVGWKLIAASILTLHGIHIPYWFDGILHWHYVFESAVLWILLVAGSTGVLIRRFAALDRHWLIAWLGSLLTVAVLTNYVTCTPYWIRQLDIGMIELRYPRRIYGAFRKQLAAEVTELPALVLVIPDPADRHMDFVTNDPRLSNSILIGRYVPAESPRGYVERVAKVFPDRQLYLYDAKTHQLTRWYH